MDYSKPIYREPRGGQYRKLLDVALARCDSCSLVWRDQFRFSEQAERTELALDPWLLSSTRASQWPGTELIGHKATVRFFRFDAGLVEVLNQAPGLFSWIKPNRPEDLAVYLENGKVLLASVAHERRWWIDWDTDGVDELKVLVEAIQDGHKED